MDVVALIMAGGRGTRMRSEGEKPLLEICGKPMIKYVIDALRGASKVSRIIVAVSKYTPKTAAFVRDLGLEVLWTPGEGFCLDLRYAIEKLNLGRVLAVSADLPLITSGIIDEVIAHYERCGKPALTVMVPLEIYERIGSSADFVFNVGGRELVPVGIDVVDGEEVRRVRGLVEEDILVMEEIRLAVNVNTPKDKRTAELMLQGGTPRGLPP